MSEGFDFYNVGKRMPYSAPDGFLDDMEAKVLERIKKEDNVDSTAHIVPDDGKGTLCKPVRLRRWAMAAVAIAACTALFVAVNVIIPHQSDNCFDDIENAFCQLSPEDQTYLLNAYQDDLFFNE